MGCQRLIDACSLNGKSKKRMKNKLSNALSNATSDSLSSSKNGCNTLFDIRSSAVWSARLSHCNIQIAELKKKLAFEQEICSQNDDDMDTYKYENKSLKAQLQSVHKKLEHQIAIKSKKNQSFDAERNSFKQNIKEWELEKQRLHEQLSQNKKT